MDMQDDVPYDSRPASITVCACGKSASGVNRSGPPNGYTMCVAFHCGSEELYAAMARADFDGHGVCSAAAGSKESPRYLKAAARDEEGALDE